MFNVWNNSNGVKKKKKKKKKNQKPKTKIWLCMAIDWKIKTKQKGGWPVNDM